MSIRIVDLHRYPVKGLSPEKLDRAILSKGDYFPGDRLFAVENGPAGFDPDKPEHQPKIKFLMLMRNEKSRAPHQPLSGRDVDAGHQRG